MSTRHHPAPRPSPVTPVDYYRNPAVRAQVAAYCGTTSADRPTAAYVVGLDARCGPLPTWDTATRVASRDLTSLWDRGCDLSRSLWDEAAVIFLLDLDYQNIDAPAEPFLRPAEAFFKLEPLYRATMRVLAGFDIHARALVTGRGYHVAGRVPLESSAVTRLVSLAARTPEWLIDVDRRRPPGVTTSLTAAHARAAEGLGLVLEFAAHEILRQARLDSAIPIVFNGTHVGTGNIGRECASIDFSHAGDPLDVRCMRAAFSTYQWHRLRPDIFGPVASTQINPIAAVPRQRDSLLAMLMRGRSLEVGMRAAAHLPARPLPDIQDGIARLIDAYDASPLAAFHQRFYAERARTAHAAPDVDLETLPPCLVEPLDHPNDLLLRPEWIQHVARVLMARGWEAGSVAELVRSRYEADHGWGERWRWMHPVSRAEFDVRVFAGLIDTGLDTLLDFNCVSAQEKDLCPGLPCRHDLRRDQVQLLRRPT